MTTGAQGSDRAGRTASTSRSSHSAASSVMRLATGSPAAAAAATTGPSLPRAAGGRPYTSLMMAWASCGFGVVPGGSGRPGSPAGSGCPASPGRPGGSGRPCAAPSGPGGGPVGPPPGCGYAPGISTAVPVPPAPADSTAAWERAAPGAPAPDAGGTAPAIASVRCRGLRRAESISATTVGPSSARGTESVSSVGEPRPS
ncbi:hypothetical protein amrb99_63590 [Actinomadura sp. RB99]|nr:hypothetical protein [Actinomadura sp. RB99]